MISWNWPLLDIYWIPEIISHIDSTNSPPWDIIGRDLILLSPNKMFSKHLLIQVKLFLTEFGLITEKSGNIFLNTLPGRNNIVNFLQNAYNNSNESWAISFRNLHEKKQLFEYRKDAACSDHYLYFLSSQSSFRQWGSFFEFINQAFLVDHNKLAPISSITLDMLKDTNFLDIIIKRRNDPRMLIEIKSTHQKGDSLLFTKGESKISITNDNNIIPRINPDIFLTIKPSDDPEFFLHTVDKAIGEYNNYVQTLYGQYITNDLGTYLYSAKLLFDYFVWGGKNILCDYVDPGTINRLKYIWENTLKIRIPLTFWNEFPKVYTATTHLCWGILYFSNYLNRPLTQMCFDEEAIKHKYINNKLFIRGKRSRVSLTKIMQTVWLIYNKSSLPEVQSKAQKIQIAINDLFAIDSNYLPQDMIDRKIILDKISEYIFISDSDKEELINKRENNPTFTQNPLLHRLGSIVNYNTIKETKYFSALLRLKERVDKYEFRLSNEVKRLNNDFDNNIHLSFTYNSSKLKEKLKFV
jgi:hypothetical protein